MKQKFKNIIGIGLLAGSLGACSNSGSSEKAQLTAAEQVVQSMKLKVRREVELKEDLSNLNEFKASLNKFRVESETAGQVAQYEILRIRPELKTSVRVERSASLGEDKARTMDQVDLGSVYKAQTLVYAFHKDGVFVGNQTVTILPDLVIEGTREMDGIQEIQVEHLIFAPAGATADSTGDRTARILTNGSDLSISAQHLISEGGEMRTWWDDQEKRKPGLQPSPGQNGASGGSIQIHAKTARGSLRVVLRGLDGVAGKDGENGKDNISDLKNGWKVGRVDGIECFVTEPRGGRGFAGISGTPGGQGGDAGSLILDVQEDLGFELKSDSQAGRGAMGGRGGKGGKGEAYQPEQWPPVRGGIAPTRCPFENEADIKGLPGVDGSAGADGKNGKDAQVCVHLGNQVYGACEKGWL